MTPYLIAAAAIAASAWLIRTYWLPALRDAQRVIAEAEQILEDHA